MNKQLYLKVQKKSNLIETLNCDIILSIKLFYEYQTNTNK
jgi:hypothetical protein